jgi:hypothetical protein
VTSDVGQTLAQRKLEQVTQTLAKRTQSSASSHGVSEHARLSSFVLRSDEVVVSHQIAVREH